MSKAKAESSQPKWCWGIGFLALAGLLCASYFFMPPKAETPVTQPTVTDPVPPNDFDPDFASKVRIYIPPDCTGPPNPLGVLPTDYVGAQACAECHKKRYDTFALTAHHNSSAFPNKNTIVASFEEGKNEMQSREPTLRFRMEQRDDGFYQTAMQDVAGRHLETTQRIGIVTGSGKIGQTYLYYKGPNLHQLPLSYFHLVDNWVNSPGYQDDNAYFARRVEADCLNCHATYYNSDISREQFETPEHIIVGISCERCHGGGAEHIKFHRQHPEERRGQHIVHPGQLSQKSQLEICGQCHSGDPEKYLKPPFSFRPGDSLEDHYLMKPLEETSHLGVHTNNQSARLSTSACFQHSENMVCTTCHNPHVLERNEKRVFSDRCRKCHQVEACGASHQLGERIADNCIDCHLPNNPDLETPIALADGEYVYPNIRDHAIAVYPELSERIAKEQFDAELRTDE